jgi:hypothetical protein
MKTKVPIACVLFAGLVLLSTCMAAASSSTLSKSEMGAIIGRACDGCAGATEESCGIPGDTCNFCNSSEEPPPPCSMFSGKVTYDESYKYCSGVGDLNCTQVGTKLCGTYYECEGGEAVPHAQCKYSAQWDYRYCEDLSGNPSHPHYAWSCRVCERGDSTGNHEVIDERCS